MAGLDPRVHGVQTALFQHVMLTALHERPITDQPVPITREPFKLMVVGEDAVGTGKQRRAKLLAQPKILVPSWLHS